MTAYRSDAQVKLTYALTPDELLASVRAQTRKPVLAMVVPSLALVLGAVAALMLLRLPLGPGLAGGGLVAFATTLFVGWAFQGTRRNLQRRASDFATIRLEATEDAFEVHGAESGKRIAWSLVLGWRETADAFLVFVDTGRFHLVPKRAFGGAEAITTFRRLLEDRVPPGGLARLEVERRSAWLPFTVAVAILAVLLGTLVEAVLAAVVL